MKDLNVLSFHDFKKNLKVFTKFRINMYKGLETISHLTSKNYRNSLRTGLQNICHNKNETYDAYL